VDVFDMREHERVTVLARLRVHESMVLYSY
jgi:hypothetical protein